MEKKARLLGLGEEDSMQRHKSLTEPLSLFRPLQLIVLSVSDPSSSVLSSEIVPRQDLGVSDREVLARRREWDSNCQSSVVVIGRGERVLCVLRENGELVVRVPCQIGGLCVISRKEQRERGKGATYHRRVRANSLVCSILPLSSMF